MVVLCSKGLSESFKSVCNKVGVQDHFKGGNTIKELVVAPEDKDNITSKGGLSTDTGVNIWDIQWTNRWDMGFLGTGTRNI